MRITTALGVCVVTSAGSLAAQAPARLNWWQDDSLRVEYLRSHGQAHAVGPIVVWTPRDSLDPSWLVAFSDSLAVAVKELQSLIGGPYAWQRIAQRPLQFYFSPGRFVSHTDGRDGVFISLDRVRQRNAPFVHEAAHELLSPVAPFYPLEYADSATGERAAQRFPFWLIEGLPDYLAQVVASRTRFPEGDVFAIGGLAKVDSTCAARLAASTRATEISERVGRSGRLEALLTTERATVAPVYYACSQSFTKYLVERTSLATLVRLFPGIAGGSWQADLESAAGKPLAALRTEWLASLGRR